MIPNAPCPAKRRRRAAFCGQRLLMLAAAMMGAPSLAAAQAQTPPAASQNPSPMVENTRAHERLEKKDLGGTSLTFEGPAGKPIDLWIPDEARKRPEFDLLIHFHGASWLPQLAATSLTRYPVVAVLNLGSGSGVYDRAFRDPFAFDSLLGGIAREVSAAMRRTARVGLVTLSGFSAGHGAIRAILIDPRHFSTVDAVLLLDGMHTSYVPEGKVLAEQGTLDTTNLVAFTEFARAAKRGEKRFLVTHSEIFPGTFASTTETADWLLRAIGLERKAVLRWGPRGLQQLSEARAGQFELLGYAGNSAPDHVDQFHAMPELLKRLSKP
jgi:hypothetical protein